VEGKILLLDCGLMFPDLDMLGIDLVLPDFTYLRENADRIIGCIATHGHEDHTGGLSFLLRELEFPIYGSALTLGLARNRIEEAGLLNRTEFIPVVDGERRMIGPFDVEFIPVTHSVPHGIATVFHTPQGVILHTGDFKLDLTPVDGRLTDLARIGAIASTEGIRLLLSDSTNAEEHGHAASETSDIADVGDLPPEKVCVISTGSQGEPMSALALMAANENRWLTLSGTDVVIMSSHPIPGNETDVSKVIDGLVRAGAEVVHSGISDVHASGHAKAEDLKMFLSIARPEHFIPVHGEYRHLVAHAKLARTMGVAASKIIVCTDGDQVTLDDTGLRPTAQVPSGYLYVDGILGDVGSGVLRDRRVLAEEGVVVVIVGVDIEHGTTMIGPEIITRGWVHAPEAEELLDQCADQVREAIADLFRDGRTDIENVQRVVRRAAGRFVNEKTKRRPMIVPVVMEA
jgi:mRNA degradation ribonuclease J1/J2